MSSRVYSQNLEDKALSHIFRHRIGTCVEVGAHDGIHLSNTYYFEQLGWRCVLVEPNRDLCEKIRETRHATLFECAASGQSGEMWLCVGSGENDVYSRLAPTDLIGVTSYLVATRPLDAMLEEAEITSIDFITIDVEGHEPAVLAGFDLQRWKPLVVLIEDNNDLADPMIEHHMWKAGYRRFYRTGVNDWYAKDGLRSATLLVRIMFARIFSLRGFVKGILPRAVARKILVAKRTVLSGLEKR